MMDNLSESGPRNSIIKTVVLHIETDGDYRASEIVADLRNTAEILFFPLKVVGYWDSPTGDHLCPPASIGNECPHAQPHDSPKYTPYLKMIEEELNGVLHVEFPHAKVSVYLA
jgi:hypothetical protein